RGNHGEAARLELRGRDRLYLRVAARQVRLAQIRCRSRRFGRRLHLGQILAQFPLATWPTSATASRGPRGWGEAAERLALFVAIARLCSIGSRRSTHRRTGKNMTSPPFKAGSPSRFGEAPDQQPAPTNGMLDLESPRQLGVLIL